LGWINHVIDAMKLNVIGFAATTRSRFSSHTFDPVPPLGVRNAFTRKQAG